MQQEHNSHQKKQQQQQQQQQNYAYFSSWKKETAFNKLLKSSGCNRGWSFNEPFGLCLTCAAGFWHCLLNHVKKDLEQDQCQVKKMKVLTWRLNPLATCAQSIFLLLLVKKVLAVPQHPEPVWGWIYQQGVVTRL